jgi:TonB family protein
MSKEIISKFIFFIVLLLIFCSINVFAQKNKCGLQLDVFQYQNNGEELKINNSKAAAYFIEGDKKKINATTNNDMPFFANLKEGIYSVEVTESSHKKSVRRVYLDCSLLNKEGLVKKRVSLFKGNPKEFVHIIEDDDYNKVSEKIPFNDLAIKMGKAEYPSSARIAHASGVVGVFITIDEQGNVSSAQAISGHPMLRATAEEAAKKSTFAPTKAINKEAIIRAVVFYSFSPN